MKNATHALVSDDDGHHYLIPRDKGAEFEAWLDAVTAYWSPYSRTQHQGDVPDKPAWADEVGGSPSLVEFHAEGYSIGGGEAGVTDEPLEGRIGQLGLDTMLRVIGVLGCTREGVRVNAGVQVEIEKALKEAIRMAESPAVAALRRIVAYRQNNLQVPTVKAFEKIAADALREVVHG